MNIIFATSDLYSRPAMVTLKTLLMNNTRADAIDIYYIENGLSDYNRDSIQQLVESYGRTIQFFSMPQSYTQIKGLIRTNAVVYSYCFFQDILPENIEKAILLEADSIVTDDLTEMYSMDITNYYLAAADDLQSKWYKRKLKMKDDSPYFNCGIMLLNLKKFREDHITDKMVEIIDRGDSKFFYEVQDELNVLMEGKIKILPPRFISTTAVYIFDYKDMLKYRRPTTVYSKEEYESGRQHPMIVHFTHNQIIQSRPWVADCTHPYKEYYDKVKATTDFANDPLWPSRRGVINKICFYIYTHISKSLVAYVLGVVHSFLYPVFLYKKMLVRVSDGK